MDYDEIPQLHNPAGYIADLNKVEETKVVIILGQGFPTWDT